MNKKKHKAKYQPFDSRLLGKRIVILSQEEHKQLTGAAQDARKIAAAAGVECRKIVQVKAKRGRMAQQAHGIEVMAKLIREIYAAEEREDIIARAGIATGYANAMRTVDLIDGAELQAMIDMLQQIGENMLDKAESLRRPFLLRSIFGKAKA